MTTAISTAGTYGSGDHHLSANISGALIFSGTATLDLASFSIMGTSNGNTVDFGVTMQGAASRLFDSIGGGKITNFWCGAKLEGAGAKIFGIDLSLNRYIGAWLAAASCEAFNNFIDRIEGVDDSAYAEGIHVAGNDCRVYGNRLLNIYKQPLYIGAGAGEGVAINAVTANSGAEIFGNIISNDTPATKTYGIFAGGASNNIHHNYVRNHWRGIAQSGSGSPQNRHNVVILESPLANSEGIGCEVMDDLAVYHNVVSGPGTPYYGDTPTTYNVAIAFPGFEEDPPSPSPPPPSED